MRPKLLCFWSEAIAIISDLLCWQPRMHDDTGSNVCDSQWRRRLELRTVKTLFAFVARRNAVPENTATLQAIGMLRPPKFSSTTLARLEYELQKPQSKVNFAVTGFARTCTISGLPGDRTIHAQSPNSISVKTRGSRTWHRGFALMLRGIKPQILLLATLKPRLANVQFTTCWFDFHSKITKTNQR